MDPLEMELKVRAGTPKEKMWARKVRRGQVVGAGCVGVGGWVRGWVVVVSGHEGYAWGG